MHIATVTNGRLSLFDDNIFLVFLSDFFEKHVGTNQLNAGY
ncbi:hypothetical protein J2X39_004321 [Dyadobacter sp. BE242]|uniref:Uncharacterized protein n=1 Tax=Dyadobacter fermentans TaxID=94254 RepID=A0ABU1R1I6_9BACT|nr:hypothetical protein [Dyadobacter fermentans]MDR7045012.1 hypothetical protein [Dyadobacter sp. BE242]